MTYERISDLPAAVRDVLSKSEQSIFRRAYNAAKTAGAPIVKARKAAWAAVNKEGPTMGQVHVDGVSWQTKPKKKKPAIAKGRILKSAEAQRYTLGIVYEPDTEDTQGDMASAAEIEQACRDFNREMIGTGKEFAKGRVRKGALGVQHQDWADEHGEIIESYIAPCPMQIGDEAVKAGAWLMGVIWSPENWAKIQAGEMTGLSMGGKAVRVEA